MTGKSKHQCTALNRKFCSSTTPGTPNQLIISPQAAKKGEDGRRIHDTKERAPSVVCLHGAGAAVLTRSTGLQLLQIHGTGEF